MGAGVKILFGDKKVEPKVSLPYRYKLKLNLFNDFKNKKDNLELIS